MTSCHYCTNYMSRVNLCSLALLNNNNYPTSCSYYCEEPPRQSLKSLIKYMGRDDNFQYLPRWIKGFLSKDYLLGNIGPWVFFEYPSHIRFLLRYKSQILKSKSVSMYRFTYYDEQFIGVTLRSDELVPPVLRGCSIGSYN